MSSEDSDCEAESLLEEYLKSREDSIDVANLTRALFHSQNREDGWLTRWLGRYGGDARTACDEIEKTKLTVTRYYKDPEHKERYTAEEWTLVFDHQVLLEETVMESWRCKNPECNNRTQRIRSRTQPEIAGNGY
ncbi:uncharacterized protein I206_101939 [Kwoniella pini CBS 10737]|uniref:Uncharacterized protein n=1 Tax=Kwoniella pini CBS 10737 TaxID=1296096 RepID=A0A1B9HV93_9TREE|nr:uncharacterized protein I206_06970 [Kwoniella pini CBS 10737]OCF47192.1 hypothetical protein I206_06970 [Kwoniella pini CBS 10737]